MTGDCHVQFSESVRVRFPRATRLIEHDQRKCVSRQLSCPQKLSQKDHGSLMITDGNVPNDQRHRRAAARTEHVVVGLYVDASRIVTHAMISSNRVPGSQPATSYTRLSIVSASTTPARGLTKLYRSITRVLAAWFRAQ